MNNLLDPFRSGWLTRAVTAAALAVGLSAPLTATPARAGALMEAITGGEVKVDARYRYEHVEADGATNDANADTLRVRLGYETGSFQNATIYYELQAVTTIGSDNYAPDAAGFPTVTDPQGEEVNQAYITYTGLPSLTVRVGNQRVKLDNDRHVGNVGWRQNEQTYDAAALIYAGVENLKVTYAYVWNVNDIVGGDTDVETHLLNINYSLGDMGSVTLYDYALDINPAPTASTNTIGLRFAGKFDAGGMPVIFNAEYAKQDDWGNQSTVDEDYMLLELGATTSGVTAKLGYEVLSGDGTGSGFETPLATKHAFNGWADQFLNTPSTGLVDTYLSVGGKVSGVKLLAVYHMFEADSGGSDYGDEIDLLAAKKLSDTLKVGLKYAGFMGDPAGTDVTKYWAFAQLAF